MKKYLQLLAIIFTASLVSGCASFYSDIQEKKSPCCTNNEKTLMSNKSYTLCIIKPDAVAMGAEAGINKMITGRGFTIEKSVKLALTKSRAEAFYAVHKERAFFPTLVEFMTSGDVVVQVVSFVGDAVSEYRKLIGATDPQKAEKGTIRSVYGSSIERNAVHGSDSHENAKIEILFFFPDFRF